MRNFIRIQACISGVKLQCPKTKKAISVPHSEIDVEPQSHSHPRRWQFLGTWGESRMSQCTLFVGNAHCSSGPRPIYTSEVKLQCPKTKKAISAPHSEMDVEPQSQSPSKVAVSWNMGGESRMSQCTLFGGNAHCSSDPRPIYTSSTAPFGQVNASCKRTAAW